MTAQPTIWPALRYDDPRAALKFLVDTVGFTETLVVTGEDGTTVTHAELRWPEGGGVMLGDAGVCKGGYEAQRAGTGAVYVVTDRVDEIHRRVTESGAEIVEPLTDTDYGSHTFTLRDAEGNLWTFGTYRGAA
ncbi:VOC family protein [Amycolatopsis anabasis]|uniref:VOC family protein n=1 Tax=Amycolatopsis anabasis TaxID=1840409 RepID=UPI00131CEFA9|nr:VOC family protein [Amycolatopsis anabasis]